MKGHVRCIEKKNTATRVKKQVKHPLRNGLMFESVSVKEAEAVYQTFYEKRDTIIFFWTLAIGLLFIAKGKKLCLISISYFVE